MQSSPNSAYHTAGSAPMVYKSLPTTSMTQPDVLLNYYHQHHHHHHQQQQLQHHHPHAFSTEALLGQNDHKESGEVGHLADRKQHSPSSSTPLVSSHHSPTSSSSSSGKNNSAVGGSVNSDLIPTSSTITINNNEVRNVMLYGIPIVSLVMDGQERLCLAQISNTLLKQFSYNEIHNRRVALGITCVQCTPVQLELLRRAGAMPVSSRRCGMITKREAERLCKSFLAETAPPKLPDSFAFDVYHACAWGCRGNFTPSRYNSSRAKCIKCVYCGLFFSPNKFIFHSHRLPNSKYVQPDAANFNSWRRHIKLVGSPEPSDHVIFAWEDVKAMFNGGSRKRTMSSTLNSFTKNQEHQDKASALAKCKYMEDNNSGLDDSDEYCSSLDVVTSTPAPSGSQQVNNAKLGYEDNALQANESPEPKQFNEPERKISFEAHFKKAFEMSSLLASSNSSARKAMSPSLSTNSSQSIPSPTATKPHTDEHMAESGPKLSNNFTDFSDKTIKPQGPVGNQYQSDLSSPSYNPFTRSQSNFFGNSTPMVASQSDSILGPSPFPLSPLHLRHPSVYLPANTYPGHLSGGALESHSIPSHLASHPTSSVYPNPVDFRHNLAEFMWSMAASKAAAVAAAAAAAASAASNPSSSPSSPTPAPPSISCPPYNLLWPGTPRSEMSPEQSSSMMSSLFSSIKSNGTTFPGGQEGLKRALLFNSMQQQQQQQQQRNQLGGPLSASNPLHFLPNFIGPNFRFTPLQNHLFAKENGLQLEPNASSSSSSSIRMPAAGELAFDCNSSMELANRSQFDAYAGNSSFRNAQLHLPAANRESLEQACNSPDTKVDVEGDEPCSESGNPLTFKSIYPLALCAGNNNAKRSTFYKSAERKSPKKHLKRSNDGSNALDERSKIKKLAIGSYKKAMITRPVSDQANMPSDAILEEENNTEPLEHQNDLEQIKTKTSGDPVQQEEDAKEVHTISLDKSIATQVMNTNQTSHTLTQQLVHTI